MKTKTKYEKARNLLLRILASPFIFFLVLIKVLWFSLERTIMFLIYGGEFINYDKHDKTMIKDIYDLLKSKQ